MTRQNSAVSIDGPPDRAEIEAWLTDHVAELLKVQPGKVDANRSFADYGLDSLAAVILSGDLEEWLGCTLPPTLAWDFPTIDRLASHLAVGL